MIRKILKPIFTGALLAFFGIALSLIIIKAISIWDFVRFTHTSFAPGIGHISKVLYLDSFVEINTGISSPKTSSFTGEDGDMFFTSYASIVKLRFLDSRTVAITYLNTLRMSMGTPSTYEIDEGCVFFTEETMQLVPELGWILPPNNQSINNDTEEPINLECDQLRLLYLLLKNQDDTEAPSPLDEDYP